MAEHIDIKALRKKLEAINKDYANDEEVAHIKFDEALLDYIGDRKVRDLYYALVKWYA